VERFSEQQQEALRPFVEDRVVHDFGAGDLSVTLGLVPLGARRIVAIDRFRMTDPMVPHFERLTCYFHDFHDPVDTAFMSWPINHDCGLTEIAQRSRTVIYMGKNTDACACGTPKLFRSLVRRKVLAHVPDFINTLIVYGPEHQDRPLLPEEHAAIHQERMWTYEELMREKWTSRWGRLLWDV